MLELPYGRSAGPRCRRSSPSATAAPGARSQSRQATGRYLVRSKISTGSSVSILILHSKATVTVIVTVTIAILLLAFMLLLLGGSRA